MYRHNLCKKQTAWGVLGVTDRRIVFLFLILSMITFKLRNVSTEIIEMNCAVMTSITAQTITYKYSIRSNKLILLILKYITKNYFNI